MRGTCCLYYQAPESQVDGGDGLCTTCPAAPTTSASAWSTPTSAPPPGGSGTRRAAGPGEG